ncbi:MAG: glycerol-3-phosphate acyltransferase [Halanaerobiales bacterium]
MLPILLIIVSYLLGSISTAYFIGKIHNIDVTQKGTGNPGATNVYLTVGPGWGFLTAVADILKGTVPTYIAKEVLQYNLLVVTGIALGAIIGHNWPLLNNFKGGRGLATTMGTIIVMNFWKGFIAFVIGLIVTAILRQKLKKDIRIWQIVYPFFTVMFLYPVYDIYKLIFGSGIIVVAGIRTWQLRIKGISS